MVDAVEIKFPAGDTYKFDLELNDDQIRGEILKTITVSANDRETVVRVVAVLRTSCWQNISTSSRRWLTHSLDVFDSELLGIRKRKCSR